jgi:hypothetical protein
MRRARAVWFNPIVCYAYPVIDHLGRDEIGVEHIAAALRAAIKAGAPKAGEGPGAYRRQSAVEARRPVMDTYARWLAGSDKAKVIAFPSRP